MGENHSWNSPVFLYPTLFLILFFSSMNHHVNFFNFLPFSPTDIDSPIRVFHEDFDNQSRRKNDTIFLGEERNHSNEHAFKIVSEK